ncbi:hypothetical protein [Ornithinimicrobium sediminis]|uniref:hypothetical protein n=1 Tax=Ornithinimicrobium sediminis TaxID=2904603 RepID=UPI001E52C540|nr:hypothetical protein [Ornithinimicrobium sediminis]MCE0485985.1 hypothetical protein [Ornithinimicrobium sediminis]
MGNAGRETGRGAHWVRLPETPVLIERLAFVILAIVALSVFQEIVRYAVYDGEPYEGLSSSLSLLDVDVEDSIPTWFASMQLAAIGGLLLTWKRELAGVERTYGWILLGVVFVGLSIDEIASVHERLDRPTRSLLDIEGGVVMGDGAVERFSGLPLWPIPVALSMIVLLATLVPFLRNLPRATLWRFVIAGAVFVSGAIGLDMLQWATGSSSTDSFLYNLVTTVEEALEMIGALLFLRAVLLHHDEMLRLTT